FVAFGFSGSTACRAELLSGVTMAESDEKQTIGQMYHLQEKEEVIVAESEQPTEEVTSEATADEEESKEQAPAEEETVADAETTEGEEAAEEESGEEPKIKACSIAFEFPFFLISIFALYNVEDIKTAPVDFRFPTTNQTRHCFTRYIEYHKCVASKGEDANECDKYAKYYRSLCPGEW
ncbi:hypothetical protein KI387_031161, partial [Taxus chinensis]